MVDSLDWKIDAFAEKSNAYLGTSVFDPVKNHSVKIERKKIFFLMRD